MWLSSKEDLGNKKGEPKRRPHEFAGYSLKRVTTRTKKDLHRWCHPQGHIFLRRHTNSLLYVKGERNGFTKTDTTRGVVDDTQRGPAHDLSLTWHGWLNALCEWISCRSRYTGKEFRRYVTCWIGSWTMKGMEGKRVAVIGERKKRVFRLNDSVCICECTLHKRKRTQKQCLFAQSVLEGKNTNTRSTEENCHHEKWLSCVVVFFS